MSYSRSLRVLIIEDEADVIEAYKTAFALLKSEDGFDLVDPVVAGGVADAIAKLSTSSPFHVVVLDLKLPERAGGDAEAYSGSGLELLDAIIGRDDYDVTFGDIVESIASAAVPLNMRVFLTLREAVEWLDLADKYDEIAKIQHTLRLQVFELPRPGDKRSLNGKLDIRLLHDKTLAQEPLNEDEDEKRDDDKDEGKGHSDI